MKFDFFLMRFLTSLALVGSSVISISNAFAQTAPNGWIYVGTGVNSKKSSYIKPIRCEGRYCIYKDKVDARKDLFVEVDCVGYRTRWADWADLPPDHAGWIDVMPSSIGELKLKAACAFK